MTLKSEIETLQAEIRARAGRAREDTRDAPPESRNQGQGASPDDATKSAGSIDEVLKLVGETLDEFGDEIDRYPRLSALTALGVGLALGLLLGRATR